MSGVLPSDGVLDEVYSGTIPYVDILGPPLHVWNIEVSFFWRLSLLYGGEKSLVMFVPVLLWYPVVNLISGGGQPCMRSKWGFALSSEVCAVNVLKGPKHLSTLRNSGVSELQDYNVQLLVEMQSSPEQIVSLTEMSRFQRFGMVASTGVHFWMWTLPPYVHLTPT